MKQFYILILILIIPQMEVYGSPMNRTQENDEIWHTYRDGHEK